MTIRQLAGAARRSRAFADFCIDASSPSSRGAARGARRKEQDRHRVPVPAKQFVEVAPALNLTNWAIEPSAAVLWAGKVTFTATHAETHGGHGAEGGETHQLLVAPLQGGKKAGDGGFGSPVLNLTEIKMGETKTGEATLERGTYELDCLLVEHVNGKNVNHYDEGVYTTVKVE